MHGIEGIYVLFILELTSHPSTLGWMLALLSSSELVYEMEVC